LLFKGFSLVKKYDMYFSGLKLVIKMKDLKDTDMKIDRMDTIGKTIYVMTEKHRYRDVLPLLKKIESNILPIKDVTVEKRGLFATGYKVPSSSGSMDKIVKVLEAAEPKI